MKKLFLVAAIAMMIPLVGCIEDRGGQGAKREAIATEQLMDQASTAVGMPAIRNFNEKRLLKMLYELRDNPALVTYSYYVDLNGNTHKVCPETSIGFGIPFSAQFTAPSRDSAFANGGTLTVMQPEPNGLYMPDSTSATWIMCLDPKSGDAVPVYVEPMVIVTTIPLK